MSENSLLDSSTDSVLFELPFRSFPIAKSEPLECFQEFLEPFSSHVELDGSGPFSPVGSFHPRKPFSSAVDRVQAILILLMDASKRKKSNE